MTASEIISEGMGMFARNPNMLTPQNICNLRIAARFKWQEEEMGGAEYVQFAIRNNTPIVPMRHECHPLELIKRGYVDGAGWPEGVARGSDIKLSKWPGGNHWYATVDGNEVEENGVQKWNTPAQAEAAAKRFATRLTGSANPPGCHNANAISVSRKRLTNYDTRRKTS